MAEKATDLNFESKEEFHSICQNLGGRLHYLNRVAMGESALVWSVADLMQRVGQVFEEHYDNKDTNAAFGDAYTKGTIAREDRAMALCDLLFPPQTKGSS